MFSQPKRIQEIIILTYIVHTDDEEISSGNDYCDI
jgi:hypothetical protein